ncbi:MAG: hypothetical protein FWG91_03065 [Lachnospiraceae bacterium]|nr:hypothetical protein [Lachnospiraceae bacterium]
MSRKPDFRNIEKVLRKEKPDRPTLFEFFLNDPLCEKLAGQKLAGANRVNLTIQAFKAAGYDYATVHGSEFRFNDVKQHQKETISLNENTPVTDRKSFDAYEWPNPDDYDYSVISDLVVPEGMKLMICGPLGVLESAINLAGYETLCMQIYDDKQFVYDLFEKVGTALLRYYKNSINNRNIGILMSNDDWGFNTQTMLSTAQMREFVLPWHKKIVELGHDAGLPVVLHSCGNLAELMDDIIDDLKYDGKHSYEDTILSVEESYKRWGGRIAILGGIDLGFIISKSTDEVYSRSKAMLELGQKAYALGTGNSVPEYVPDEKYFAMTKAALEA